MKSVARSSPHPWARSSQLRPSPRRMWPLMQRSRARPSRRHPHGVDAFGRVLHRACRGPWGLKGDPTDSSRHLGELGCHRRELTPGGIEVVNLTKCLPSRRI